MTRMSLMAPTDGKDDDNDDDDDDDESYDISKL